MMTRATSRAQATTVHTPYFDQRSVKLTVSDSKQEKPARANVFTAVTRSLGPETIVICDSANYIKGFRYQMYVAAREAHARTCTIHVAAPPNKCREWHVLRQGDQAYKSET